MNSDIPAYLGFKILEVISKNSAEYVHRMYKDNRSNCICFDCIKKDNVPVDN